MRRSRPKVMRIVTRLAGGGPPLHVTLLNRRLEDFGFDSMLVIGQCVEGEMNMEYLLAPGDRVERIPTLASPISPLNDLRSLFQLWRLMRRERPDIVHTHTAKAGLIGRLAARLAGCDCVVHTFHGHILEGYFSAPMNWLMRHLERFLATMSSILCVVSRQQAKELSRRFRVAREDRFRVVPLGLNLEKAAQIALPDPKESRWKILWLGRFVAIKNLPLLLEIAALCQQRGLPVDFLLAGDGPLRSWVEETIASQRLKNCTLFPWQRNIDDLLGKSHLTILTSIQEGTPASLIQAMAAGRPFLATPAGGTVDLASGVCRAEGSVWRYDNGILCGGRPEVFVGEIERLLSQPETLLRMGEAARNASQVYSAERLVSDIAALYRELLIERAVSSTVMEMQL